MRTIGVIPARMGSSRFPGKPLALLHGIPMLGHVYFRSRLNRRLAATYIATCDEEICALREGDRAPMHHDVAVSRPRLGSHGRGCERDRSAFGGSRRRRGHDSGGRADGASGNARRSARPSGSRSCGAGRQPDGARSTRMPPLDANEIKVVVARNGNALYFSRHAIPWHAARARSDLFKQICIIPFRREFLTRFAALEPTPLERAESIDMLRALEHGYRGPHGQNGARDDAVSTRRRIWHAVEALMRGDAPVGELWEGRRHEDTVGESVISAPYARPCIDRYQRTLEAAGCDVIVACATERLEEDQLLALLPGAHGIICGDDRIIGACPRGRPRFARDLEMGHRHRFD